MSTQLNTTLTPRNVGELTARAAVAAELGVALWSVYLKCVVTAKPGGLAAIERAGLSDRTVRGAVGDG